MYYLNAANQGADLVADDPHPLTMTGVETYASGPLGEYNGAMQFSANIDVSIPNISDSDMMLQKSFTNIMQVRITLYLENNLYNHNYILVRHMICIFKTVFKNMFASMCSFGYAPGVGDDMMVADIINHQITVIPLNYRLFFI